MPAEPRARVAFITGEYPKASETFLLRELRELKRRGLGFVVVATAKLPDIPEAAGIDAPVLLRPAYFSWPSLAAELRFCSSHPLGYVGPLAALYRGHWRNARETTQMMFNVPRALALGYELRRMGVTRVHALWASLPATLGWIIARSFNMKFSFAAHSRDVYVDGRMLKDKAELADAIVCCNRAAAGRLGEVIGERLARKITLVHHGIERETLPPRASAPGDFILAAGRFEPKKGFDVLIRACASLKQKGRPVRCVIVGEGAQQEMLAGRIKREGAPVELRGWMRHDELMSLVAKARAVIIPSVVASTGDRDGIPNIALEAMAIGVPVIATDLGGIGEVIRNGETGWLVEPGKPEALAAAIGEVLAKGAVLTDITQRANELIRRDFSLSDTVSTLERLLRD